MMAYSYYRVCTSVRDKGTLVKEGTDLDKYTKGEAYISAFKYNEEHKKLFEKNGSVAGITDVTTDIIYFDLDNEDIEVSRKDTIEVVNRLSNYGISSNQIKICLSGNKGFHISIHTTETFTPEEAKSLAIKLAGDLPSFDSSIYNSNRIIRLEGSLHKKTGLRKTPISFDELQTLKIADIKSLATTSYAYDKPIKVKPTEAFIKLTEPITERKKEDELTLDSGVDYLSNPYKLQPWKLAISQGFFPNGSRSNALMILGATLMNKGLLKEQCYYALKAAADLQSDRYGKGKFSKEEIWEKIVEQVYKPTWNGGSYSEDNFPTKLQEYFEELGIPRKEYSDVASEVVRIEDKFDDFVQYASDIDKYTMKFGIPSLDSALKVRKGHLIGLLAGPGIGKCLAYGTEVLMYDGSLKEVQDIKEGELVMGDDSTPRKVQGLARGKEMMYKIHTDDGSYTVNESHILSLKGTRTWGNMTKGETINISVKEYLEKDHTFKRRTMGYRNPIRFHTKEVPFDPYLVGLWLGDGTRTKPEISSIDKEVKWYLEDFCENNGYSLTIYEGDKCPRLNLVTERNKPNPFLEFIQSFEGIKYIPENYKKNDFTVRKELLAGLIDSDGHYNAKQDCYEYTSKDKQLAQDIRFLCRSIGLKCTMKETWKSLGDFTGDYYRLYIKGDLTDVPMKIPRKQQDLKNHQRNPQWYSIKVEELEVDNYYGFELDGNKLFVLGDLSVTHNTSFGITLLNNCSKAGSNCFFASMDMYSLNVYQKLIQRHTGYTEEEMFEFFKKKDQHKIEEFRKVLKDNYGNVSFSFKSGMSISELKKSISMEEDKLGDKLDLVLVDYLELIQTDKTDPTASSAEAINGLREIANEGRVVVVLLQPNKISSKPDQPLLSYNSAKGSSMIAQAVTAMLTAHRPGYSSENPENDLYFSVNCVKNRNGALFQRDFGWIGKTQTIYELDNSEREHLKLLRDTKQDAEDDF